MEFMGAKARLRDNFRCMSSVASARLQDALCKIATLNIGLEDAAIYMVRRLAFPAPPPPPQWHGLAGGGGGGGGAGLCGEWSGGLGGVLLHGSQRGPGS